MSANQKIPPAGKEHSPGPWAFTIKDLGETGKIAYVTADNGHDEIAVLYLNDTEERLEANARLIAAVTDLLEACTLAFYSRQWDEVNAVLKAAILKAGGELP